MVIDLVEIFVRVLLTDNTFVVFITSSAPVLGGRSLCRRRRRDPVVFAMAVQLALNDVAARALLPNQREEQRPRCPSLGEKGRSLGNVPIQKIDCVVFGAP